MQPVFLVSGNRKSCISDIFSYFFFLQNLNQNIISQIYFWSDRKVVLLLAQSLSELSYKINIQFNEKKIDTFPLLIKKLGALLFLFGPLEEKTEK